MSKPDLDAQLSPLFESIIGLPRDQFHDEISPDNTATWDSLAHLNLIIAVEETFGVALTPEETLESTSVKLLKLLLQEKLEL
jgi:acyl carrier protein